VSAKKEGFRGLLGHKHLRAHPGEGKKRKKTGLEMEKKKSGLKSSGNCGRKRKGKRENGRRGFGGKKKGKEGEGAIPTDCLLILVCGRRRKKPKGLASTKAICGENKIQKGEARKAREKICFPGIGEKKGGLVRERSGDTTKIDRRFSAQGKGGGLGSKRRVGKSEGRIRKKRCAASKKEKEKKPNSFSEEKVVGGGGRPFSKKEKKRQGAAIPGKKGDE